MHSTAFDYNQFVSEDGGKISIRCPSPERSTLASISYPVESLRDHCNDLAKSLKTLAKNKVIPAAFSEAIIHAQNTAKGE